MLELDLHKVESTTKNKKITTTFLIQLIYKLIDLISFTNNYQ